MVIINIEEQPIEVKHISYFTVPSIEPDYIELWETVEEFYDHPQAKGLATIPRFHTVFVRKERRTKMESGSLILLEAAENAMREIQKTKGT